MNVAWLRTALLIRACLIPLSLSAEQKISVDYDRDVDFSRYSTYTWREGRPVPNPLIDKRVLDAIDRQLSSRGWTKADAAPTAIVVYSAGRDVHRQLNGWNSGPRWSGFGTVTVEEKQIGQLLVDIYDAFDGRLLWRGFASDTISDNPEKNQKRLNDAAAKLFKQFPPSRAGATGTR